MLEYLEGVKAAFVTNAVSHAQTLAKMGIRVYLIGGELKSSTEAVVGSQAMQMIQMYHLQRASSEPTGSPEEKALPHRIPVKQL